MRVGRLAAGEHRARVGPVGLHRVRGAQHRPHHPPRQRHRHRRRVARRSPRASARARRSTSSAGCTLRTSPPASASSAVNTRPVATHSIACEIPTTRGRNQHEHASGTIPRRANTKPDLGPVGRDAHVHRQRHRDADAHGRAVDRRDHRLQRVEDAQRDLTAAVARHARLAAVRGRASRTCPPPPPRSAPAQNPRPAPVTITRARRRRRRTRSNASISSRPIVGREGVQAVGPVQRDREHVVGHLVADLLEVHARSLSRAPR